jgi:hypothetical protein
VKPTTKKRKSSNDGETGEVKSPTLSASPDTDGCQDERTRLEMASFFAQAGQSDNENPTRRKKPKVCKEKSVKVFVASEPGIGEPDKKKPKRNRNLNNKLEKNWTMAMKRHWGTDQKDKAMELITITRAELHTVQRPCPYLINYARNQY